MTSPVANVTIHFPVSAEEWEEYAGMALMIVPVSDEEKDYLDGALTNLASFMEFQRNIISRNAEAAKSSDPEDEQTTAGRAALLETVEKAGAAIEFIRALLDRAVFASEIEEKLQ